MSTAGSGTKCSGTQPSPSTPRGSQNEGRSSEGCNISHPVEDNEVYEQFVEVDVEQAYLSDNEVANGNCIEESSIELNDDFAETTVHLDSEHSISYDADNPRIELNALFPDVYAFRKSLRHFAIKNEFEYVTVKSDKKRFMANCKHKDCPWRIRAYRLRDDNKTFKVTVLPHPHSCPSITMAEGKMTNMAWVSDRASNWLRRNPSGMLNMLNKAIAILVVGIGLLIFYA